MRSQFGIIMCSVLVWITSHVYSQSTKITSKNLAEDAPYNNSMEEQLVKLALANNPTNAIAVYRSQLAQRNVNESQRAWLNQVRIQGNLNEFTLNPEGNVRSQYYPRYNFSLTFTLGDFLGIPATTRSRKIEHEISKLEVDNQVLQIRSEVLRLYNHYRSVKDRLVIQKKLESETGINLELARSKFSQGHETYETLSALIERHYTLQLTIRELEESLTEAELNLEEMIGVELETILIN